MKIGYVGIYSGDISKSLTDNQIDEFMILSEDVVVFYTEKDFNQSILNNIPEISWWTQSLPMSSLIDITNNIAGGETVTYAADTDFIYKNPYIKSSGKGVIVGIIDSGIEYTHPDFIDSEGNTRIISIWDQTSGKSSPPNDYFLGSEFTKEEINEAIKSNNRDLTVDDVGTGTLAASIACGNGNLVYTNKGVAIDSELVVVKLRSYEGMYVKDKKNYTVADFLAGIKYVVDIGRREGKPVIINLTVAARASAIFNSSILDIFNSLTQSGVVVVCGAGNEGNTDIHYEGNIKEDMIRDITIQVGDEENIDIVLNGNGPDRIGAMVISPSGEVSYNIQYSPDYDVYSGKFNLENTFYEMRFVYPWISSGMQELYIRLIDVKPGVWTIRLMPEFVINGNYDVYLPNRNMVSSGSRFIDPSSLSTITLYGESENVITVGAYNEKTNSIWIGSSKGPIKENGIKPDIVAPGVDIIGAYKNNSYNTATGTGVSSSITSGALAIIMEYILNQTETPRLSLFTEVLKTYLMLGAKKNEIYTFPNISQGYGVLDIKETIIQIANNL